MNFRRYSFLMFATLTLVTMVVAPPVIAGDLQNTVKWTTASEVDNFGYDVYRSNFKDGPFTRVSLRPVAGAGTTDEPQQYQYIDDSIEANRAYFYFVESIDLSGKRERFTPIFKSKPKYPSSRNH